jgi:hypothetical protein
VARARSIPVGAILSAFALLAGCRAKPLLEGEVLDGFSKPLKDVSVVVESTRFKAVTDFAGRYQVAYFPGKVNLRYFKDGYTAHTLNFEIATENSVPVERIVLHRIPSTQGVWFVGKEDYLPLERGFVSASESKGTWGSRYFYRAIPAKPPSPLPTGGGSAARFVDNHPEYITLLKIDEATGMLGTRLTSLSGANDQFSQVEEKITRIAKNMVLRETTAAPGTPRHIRFCGHD